MTQETILDTNELIAQRRAKLADLKAEGFCFPNQFRRDHYAQALHDEHGESSPEQLEAGRKTIRVAGRLVARRLMGKASFIHLQDMSGRIQAYLRNDDLPEGLYEAFKHWDLGDIVGVSGYLFKTKTGELSLHAQEAYLLTKSLRPLPEKFHGLSDQETRYRQRYLDLISNESSRKIFQTRSKAVAAIRDYLTNQDFMEVETPMMQVIPGGATARPFITHHNALNMDLYLRVAPELYLKRLVVGGFERVFEINRNFRNEGLSTRHNPEFTMLEFYQAYGDYKDGMLQTEQLLRTVAQSVLGTAQLNYQDHTFDLGKPFTQISLQESIVKYNKDVTLAQLDDINQAKKIADRLEVNITEGVGLGGIQQAIFDESVEHHLIQPTFITSYPAEVSPLARPNDENPFITDRFELFIAGQEIANGFSELNDPEIQSERFRAQAHNKAAGNLEAMHYDEDYITALEHGLPPTVGVGIGIDRFMMLLTDSPSIRDVLLFPLMKPRS